MAQEHAKSCTCAFATSKEPFAQLSWTQRQPLKLLHLLQLFFSLAIAFALTDSASSWQSEKPQSFAFVISHSLTYTTAPHKKQKLHTLAISLKIPLTSTKEEQKLLCVPFASTSSRSVRKLLTLTIAASQERRTRFPLSSKETERQPFSFTSASPRKVCVVRLSLSFTLSAAPSSR